MSFHAPHSQNQYQRNAQTTGRKRVSEVAASMVIEEESGTFSGRVHPHNGYYAGDFSSHRPLQPAAWETQIPAFG